MTSGLGIEVPDNSRFEWTWPSSATAVFKLPSVPSLRSAVHLRLATPLNLGVSRSVLGGQ